MRTLTKILIIRNLEVLKWAPTTQMKLKMVLK